MNKKKKEFYRRKTILRTELNAENQVFAIIALTIRVMINWKLMLKNGY